MKRRRRPSRRYQPDEVRSLAREQSHDALLELMAITRDTSQPTMTRLEAIDALMEFAIGPPEEPVVVIVTDGSLPAAGRSATKQRGRHATR